MENLFRSKEYWGLKETRITIAPPNATPEQLKVVARSNTGKELSFPIY